MFLVYREQFVDCNLAFGLYSTVTPTYVAKSPVIQAKPAVPIAPIRQIWFGGIQWYNRLIPMCKRKECNDALQSPDFA